jgi:hypothetical protein
MRLQPATLSTASKSAFWAKRDFAAGYMHPATGSFYSDALCKVSWLIDVAAS